MGIQPDDDGGDLPPIADDCIEVDPEDFDPGPPDDVDPDTELDQQFRDLSLFNDPPAEFDDQAAEDTAEETHRRRIR
jgi:hypothetical protein